MDASSHIQFDGWTLNTRSGELLRDGNRIRLQPQPLLVLEALLASPGEVVTREQLIARLWPKGVVDFDTALNSAVRRLRQALGDDAETPRYIETIARRGYRFIGTVTPPGASPMPPGPSPQQAAVPAEGPEDAAPPTAEAAAVGTIPSAGAAERRASGWRGRPLAAVAVLLCAVAAIGLWGSRSPARTPDASGKRPASAPAIAVLPFVDMSPAHDQAYFADGLAEEVINLLAQTPRLRVTARTSSFVFRDQRADIPTIARRLGVTHVLEGSVRRAGDRVRITAQLIDARSNLHLWSQTYDRRLDDIFAVQSDIAASVAGALRLVLQNHAGVTASPEAYDRYLLARYVFSRRAPGDIELARQYYQQALDLDPKFSAAWAGLASAAWVGTAEGAMPPGAGLEQVRSAAEKALALDPQNAEAHLRLALYLDRQGHHTAANDHVREAMTLEPNNPLALGMSAGAASADGRTSEAISLLRQAVTTDPFAWVYRYNLADMLYQTGNVAQASEQVRELLVLQPANMATRGLACFILVVQHHDEEAMKLLADWPTGGPDRLQCQALADSRRGPGSAADVALATLSASGTSSDALRVAEIYAWRGERDAAFHWLQAAAVRSRAESGFGPYGRPLPRGDPPPLLASLRDDPRWKEWAASLPQAGTGSSAR